MLPEIRDTFSQTICAGNSVNFCGIDRDQSGIFTCNLTAIGGCDSVVTLDLKVNPKPVASISAFPGPTITCKTASVQLTATGTSSGSILWSTGETVPFIYPSAGGTFSVTVTAGGCSDTASIQILEDKKTPAMSLSLSQPSIFCSGQTVVVTASSPDSPTYRWQGGPATGEHFPTNAAGLVFVEATAPNGCDTTLSINIPQAVPTIEAFAETLCAGRCTMFAGAERCATGIYRDTIRTASGGCDSIFQTLNLTVLPMPVRLDTVRICAGEGTVFCNEKIYDAGTFDCLLETPGGCDSLVQRTVEVRPLPVLVARDDAATLPPGADSLEIAVSANDVPPADGTWFLTIVQQPTSGQVTQGATGGLVFERLDAQFSGPDTAIYALCSGVCADVCDSTQVLLFVQNSALDDLEKGIHNVITPGGSPGQNDVFDPVGYLLARDFAVDFAELSVFNRWGELLFFEKGDHPTWDGRDAKGRIVPQAAYYFSLKTEDGATKRTFKGAVTVLR